MKKNGRKTKPKNQQKTEDQLSRRKMAAGVPQQTTLNILRPVVLDVPYFDFNFSVSPTTTVAVLDPLDGLLGAGGLLQGYPQHAEGQFSNGVFRLRQRIRLLRCEIRSVFIGAVSNAVLAADLYNNVRCAMYVAGEDYSTPTPPVYLNGVSSGTSTLDIKGVYFDKTVSLPSQAYDSTITTPTPQVKNWECSFDPKLTLICYSTTPTGGGAAWDTEERDLILAHVSDSSVAPHPTWTGTVRMFFDYVQRR